MLRILTHPIDPRFGIPFRRAFLQLRPKFNGALACDISYTKLALVPAAKGEWLPGNRNANVDADHAGAGTVDDIAGKGAVLRKDGSRIAIRAGVLDGNCLIEGIDAHDADHRAKDLFGGHGHPGFYIIDHGRTDIGAAFLPWHGITPSVYQYFCPLLLGFGDI